MIRIGIICPSEIAFRRFMPTLNELKDKFSFIGIAYASPEEWFGRSVDLSDPMVDLQQKTEFNKAKTFVDDYGGRIFSSYADLVSSSNIDAVYIPLPPALHYEWAMKALLCGKQVMVEKPCTVCLEDTESLIECANKNSLALHENYMFVFHDQIAAVNRIVEDGVSVGIPRLYRLSFGFPRRSVNDFRYNRALGGGALLDAGGYTLRYATELLGDSAKVVSAQSTKDDISDVDIFGSATLINDNGMTAQVAFGMDNDYHCDIEVWGSLGTLTSNRILTAPIGYIPTCTLKKNQEVQTISLKEDNAFKKSLLRFYDCILNEKIREENYRLIRRQADVIQQFKNIAHI